MLKKTVCLLTATLLACTVAFAGGGNEKAAQANIKFVYGGSDTVGSLFDKTNFKMVELLREKSKGAITIDWFPADQLGGDLDQIQSVIAGSQTLYGDDISWIANWEKDFNVMGWGFTFRDRNHFQSFMKSEQFKKMAAQFETKHNVKVLGATASGARMLYSKTPVKTLKDIADKKMRIPEIESYLRLWEALGTRPTRVTWAEVYMGLKQGVIEACEGSASSAYAAKLHEAAPNVTLTRHLMQGYFMLMNGNVYNSLSPEMKKLVQECADQAIAFCDAESVKMEEEAIGKMKAEGANILLLDNVREWQDKVNVATSAMEDKGMWRKGLYEEIQKVK